MTIISNNLRQVGKLRPHLKSKTIIRISESKTSCLRLLLIKQTQKIIS